MPRRSARKAKTGSRDDQNPSTLSPQPDNSTRDDAGAPSQPLTHVSQTPSLLETVPVPRVTSAAPAKTVDKGVVQVSPAQSAATLSTLGKQSVPTTACPIGAELRQAGSSIATKKTPEPVAVNVAASAPASAPTVCPNVTTSANQPSDVRPQNVDVDVGQVIAVPSDDGDVAEAIAVPNTKVDVDEVIAVPIKQNEESGFAITNYVFKQCYVDIDKLIDPRFVSREINYEHSEHLKTRLRESDFNQAMGTISLVITPKKNGEMRTEWIDDELNVTCPSFITDGRHRRLVLTELCDEDPEKWGSLYHRAPASAILRKDGELITMMEMLGLSAYLNKHSSTVLATSFVDYVYAAMSTVKLLAALTQKHVKGLTITEVTDELKLHRTLGGLEDRQLRRYATVAHRLAEQDDYYKVFKTACQSGVSIGIVHVNCRRLLGIQNVFAFQLAFACLRSILINGVRSSFEALHDPFYGCIAKLFKQIETTATYKDMSVQDLFDSELLITANDPKTLFEYVADMMGRYNLVENQDAADKSRLTNLRKKLVALLGDDIEPASEAPKTSKPKSVSPKTKAIATKATGKRATSSAKKGSSSEPRRSGRKRRAVDRNGDTNALSRKRKKRTLPRKSPAKPAGVLSRESVSEFLRNLAPEQISSLLHGAGLQVVRRESPESSDDDLPDEEVLSNSKAGTLVRSVFDAFDDSIPNTLPGKWADPSPYEGQETPSWIRFVTKLPSRWPADNPVKHVGPWFRSLHLPHQHRAHSVITDLETLRRNHHLVYWRAAHNVFKDLPKEELPTFVDKYGELIYSEKVWAAALEEDDVALAFFAEKREQVFHQGFCILENFLQDTLVPSKLGSVTVPKIETERPFFKPLADEAKSSFPGETNMRNPVARDIWNFIQNVSATDDAAAAAAGEGRARMTNHGIMARLENDPDLLWAVTGRALVDMRIGQSVAALKLADNARRGVVPMMMPNTGGRWILPTDQCERQSLHTCVKPLNRHRTLLLNQCPGYFTIATGEHEVPFWVCANSHRSLATASSANIKAVSQASVVHMVRIPPFSIFIGRGDMHHAAPSSTDGIAMSLLCYQTYILPVTVEIPTSIYKLSKFKPPFKFSIGDDTEEEDSAEEAEEPANTTPGGVKQPVKRQDISGDEYESEELGSSGGDSDSSASSDDDDVDYEELQ